MNKTASTLGIVIMALGIIGIIFGALFVFQGFAKQNVVLSAMKEENISMAPFGGNSNEIIDSVDKAQKAGDTVREHRHSIAPTYGELLGGNKYDPTNPVQLTYAQAMNLENYIYLGVASLGLVQVVLGSGAFMVIVGLTLIVTGYAVRRLAG